MFSWLTREEISSYPCWHTGRYLFPSWFVGRTFAAKLRIPEFFCDSHILHTYIYHKFKLNVGKYSSPMEPVGLVALWKLARSNNESQVYTRPFCPSKMLQFACNHNFKKNTCFDQFSWFPWYLILLANLSKYALDTPTFDPLAANISDLVPLDGCFFSAPSNGGKTCWGIVEFPEDHTPSLKGFGIEAMSFKKGETHRICSLAFAKCSVK